MLHSLIARLTSRTPYFGVPYHNAFSLFFTSRALSVSNTNHHQGGSFTVSSLINSSGLPPETALKLSKRLQLRNPDGPNAVVELLRKYGFSETQLCKLVKRHPFVLLSNPDKILLPKLKFLHSIGVSTTELPRMSICFLTRSLEKTIVPHYEIVRSLVRNDKEVVSTLKHGSWSFLCGEVLNDSVPNIEALRKLALPQGSISLLVSNFPNVVFVKHSRFAEAVKTVKEMGFDPSKSNFVLALQVVAKMDKTMWKSRLKVFERWGWSRDICFSAFKKYPQYMMISEKKIVKMLSFLVKDMGLSPEDIARSPGILNRNFEKTFIPRCGVVKILRSRGLIKSNSRVSSFILISEKRFLERYVTRFQKVVPLLLDAYKGQRLD